MRDNKLWRGRIIHDKFDLKITTFILILDLDMPKNTFAYIYIQSKAKIDQIFVKKAIKLRILKKKVIRYSLGLHLPRGTIGG